MAQEFLKMTETICKQYQHLIMATGAISTFALVVSTLFLSFWRSKVKVIIKFHKDDFRKAKYIFHAISTGMPACLISSYIYTKKPLPIIGYLYTNKFQRKDYKKTVCKSFIYKWASGGIKSLDLEYYHLDELYENIYKETGRNDLKYFIKKTRFAVIDVRGKHFKSKLPKAIIDKYIESTREKSDCIDRLKSKGEYK